MANGNDGNQGYWGASPLPDGVYTLWLIELLVFFNILVKFPLQFCGQKCCFQNLSAFAIDPPCFSDLVEGLILLMNCNYSRPVNLGNPDEYTILEFARVVQEEVGGWSMFL